MRTSIKALEDEFGDGLNGVLPLRMGMAGGFHRLIIAGGPFMNASPAIAPYKTFLVNLREEPSKRADLHFPIRDFSVPDSKRWQELEDTIVSMLDHAMQGDLVYVGCTGGIGRTGMMLALLAKTVGVAQPVDYVREHYLRHAVETRQQEAFIDVFDVAGARKRLRRLGWGKHRLHKLFGFRKLSFQS